MKETNTHFPTVVSIVVSIENCGLWPDEQMNDIIMSLACVKYFKNMLVYFISKMAVWK